MNREGRQATAHDVGRGTDRDARRLRLAEHDPVDAGPTVERPVAVRTLRAELEAATPDADLQLISLSEAARFLCVSRGTLYDLLRTGQLASVHIGRLRRVPIGELRRFVAARLASE